MSADLEWNGQATLGHAFLRKGREVEGNGMGQRSTMLHIWHTINPREETAARSLCFYQFSWKTGLQDRGD